MADWKYDLEDLEDDGDSRDGDGHGDDTSAGHSLPPDRRIEPGSPTRENAAFVALGVATAVFVFVQVLG